MNILLLSPVYPPSKGGVENQVELLAQGLTKYGHNVSVITSSLGTPHNFAEAANIIRFPMPKTPLDYLNGYLFIHKNLQEIKNAIKSLKIDIIHIHQIEMSASFVWQVHKKVDIPIVVTVHTSASLTHASLLRMVFRIYPIRYIEKRSVLAASKVIAISDELAEYCRKFQDCIIISDGIDLEYFTPRSDTPFHTPVRIICPGRISPEKGQIVLSKAVRCFDNVKVYYVTDKPYNEIADCYRKADLIVIPSLYESFGLAALENLAMGNIVIASNVGGLKNLIRHGENGILFERGNAEDLAMQIKTVLNGGYDLPAMRKSAIKSAQKYGVDKMVDITEDAYRETLWDARKKFQSEMTRRIYIQK